MLAVACANASGYPYGGPWGVPGPWGPHGGYPGIAAFAYGPHGPAAVPAAVHAAHGAPWAGAWAGPWAGPAHAHAVAPAHGATYTAKTRGAVHTAPLAGHVLSQTSVNVAPAPGTW
jgi:Cuticle protein